MKKIYLFFCFSVLYVGFSFGQKTTSFQQQQVQRVFDNVFNALGKNRANKPTIYYENSPEINAEYTDNSIQVFSGLYKLCQSMGSDSTNALAFALGHELVHFYQQQEGIKSFVKANEHLSSADTTLEYNADIRGAFCAYYAGYKIKGIIPKFIEALYNANNFEEKLPKYATKKVRMNVATLAQNKIDSMVLVYEFANYMNIAGFFDSAINGYNYIKEFYPGKEIYNNTAIAYANYVQAELPLFSLDSPNYSYPMYIDRLAGFSGNRTNDIEFDAEKIKLRANYLNLALQNLDEAIQLDPNYAAAQINRLCILFLQGKIENILSQINTLKSNLKTPLDLEKLSIMESIIYLHNGQKNKAILLLNDLLGSKNKGIKTMARSNLNIAEGIEIVEQNARCTLQFDETIDNEKSQEKPLNDGSKPVFLQKIKNSNRFYFKKSKTEVESTIYLLAEPHRERSIWAQRFPNNLISIAKGIAVGSDIKVALQKPIFGTPTMMNWHCGKYYHFQDCKVIIVTNHKDQIMEWLRYDVY